MLYRLIICLSLISSAFCNAPKLKVVATFSILGDLIRQVGGVDVEVNFIVPESADPHVYQPTPQDAAMLAKAELVFINGLDFEGWLERLIANSGYTGEVITASAKVKPRILVNSKGETVDDPHAWHCVKNAMLYVECIADALIAARPSLKDKILKNKETYLNELIKLEEWVQAQYQRFPAARRLVVTTHDAFWYYGDAYNITFLSPVGISTDAEPSAAAVANLIKDIRTKNIRAVFIESLSSRKLIVEIAAEAGVNVDGTLYADSLSASHQTASPAQSYVAMIRHNTQEIVKGLDS
ncbi:metal ABC transporter solute-binding protein, Zn/Mn family [Candidatus Odyssella thessalonicensis]|uniref:metal ABC transporter solute-binding protein, Zn/Mn family n=1 Tax=Candidatus Odyssella thessalonicensis TaxID=84647 RepID=UPI000225C1D6|nr:zinc ABC transporter substrate-binding protein [Candidatus Odyssella thessalonicensis]